MRDEDIRPGLRQWLYREHAEVQLFEELPLCRTGRADIAAVNCSLWGYEIKSECDTLNRLPCQISLYDQVFDYSLVVTTEKHLRFALRILPAHWGVYLVENEAGGLAIHRERAPQFNETTSAEALVRLLWKKEAIRVLRLHDIEVRSSALVNEIWKSLLRLPKQILQRAVRDALKVRASTAAELP